MKQTTRLHDFFRAMMILHFTGWKKTMLLKALATGLVAFVFISMASAAEENEPDAELLEFLADWDSGDGQWIEPFSFEQADTAGMRRDNGDVQATQERHDEH